MQLGKLKIIVILNLVLPNEKDYIKNTPDTGYKSLHLVYNYNKDIETNKQCRVEIQIRTHIHHSWATAVEVMGTYLGQPLKQNFGDKKYLDIFNKISKVFKVFEQKNIDFDFIDKVEKEIKNLNLLDKLNAFAITSNIIFDHHKSDYLLVTLDLINNKISIKGYSARKFYLANEDYLIQELENIDNNNIEVVLLSIDNVKKIKQYYPNYFMDTKEFALNLKRLFNYNKQIKQANLLQKDILDDKINTLTSNYFNNFFIKK